MRRVAIKTLFHGSKKAFSAIVGVAAATTLILVQVGLYYGFLATSSAFVQRTGGDVWVTASGTPVLDEAEALSDDARHHLASHPCVERVRGVIVAYGSVRTPSGTTVTAQILGVDEHDGGRPMPWAMRRGLPADIDSPGAVAVDSMELSKLAIEGRDPIGAPLHLSGDAVRVAALTHGIRPFTLMPYVFARLPLARRLAGYAPRHASYWVADLASPGCAAGVIAHARRHPDADAFTTARFVKMTQDFWVNSSGIGAVLTAGTLMAFLIGMIVIGQTLSAITRSHLTELGTLKALGASEGELVSFVAWQAAFLATVGASLGVGLALAVQRAVAGYGLAVVLTRGVLAVGAGAVLVMCAFASGWSMRTVLELDANEVLK